MRGGTLLIVSTMCSQERLVELLLEREAALDLQDYDGDSALILAAYQGLERIVEMLLDRGAAVDLQNSSGVTALIESRGAPVTSTTHR